MTLHGKHLIAGEQSFAGNQQFQSFNPNTNTALETQFFEATADEVDRALTLAKSAQTEFSATAPETRAALLDSIATRIEQHQKDLVELCMIETAYPRQRVVGELQRTLGQTRMFANLLREGSWIEAKIDTGQPERTPIPKPDVRSMLRGLGIVVVFGASNFPLAISVAGTDTITAFAAGCPVVVKAHPAHPGTCEFIASLICQSIQEISLPAGIFSLLQGRQHELGRLLVEHESTAAVAFTGSLAGGKALQAIVNARPRPIPFYAEMGSVNPVIVMPGAIAARCEQIASGFVESLNLGVGQFCTSPGMLLVPKTNDGDRLIEAIKSRVDQTSPGVMLHRGIHEAYEQGIQMLREAEKATLYPSENSKQATTANRVSCVLAIIDAENVQRDATETQELFGPCAVLVRCEGLLEIQRLIELLGGQLTATLHGTDQDLRDCQQLISTLENAAGRVICNGFPTGVEVCHAMHHGGPYPAASDPHFTSIGVGAIKRFVRPVCYQDVPDAFLPLELRNKNGRGILRLVNGVFTRANA